jgi:hypothetical protein
MLLIHCRGQPADFSTVWKIIEWLTAYSMVLAHKLVEIAETIEGGMTVKEMTLRFFHLETSE